MSRGWLFFMGCVVFLVGVPAVSVALYFDIYIRPKAILEGRARVYVRDSERTLVLDEYMGSLLINWTNQRIYRISSYERELFGAVFWPKDSYQGVDVTGRAKNEWPWRLDFRERHVTITKREYDRDVDTIQINRP